MSWTATTFKFAMAVGAGGTYVDISDKVVFSEGSITRQVGRTNPFSDTPPGQFAFTLDNRDGRFTPDNPFSPLAVTLSEGMGVCWQLDSRLVSGNIRSIDMIFSEPGSPEISRVRVTCDDMLGSAARHDITSLVQENIAAQYSISPFTWWPMSDAAGSGGAAASPAGSGAFLTAGGGVTFGVEAPSWVGATQALLSGTSSLTSGIGAPKFILGTRTVGMWVTPTGSPSLTVNFTPPGSPAALQFGISGGQFFAGPTSALVSGGSANNGSPVYVACAMTFSWNSGTTTAQVSFSLTANGVSVVSTVYSFAKAVTWSPFDLNSGMSVTNSGSGTSTSIANLTFGPALNLELYLSSTEAARLQAIDTTTPEVTLASLPGDLSTVNLGPQNDGDSALDAINDVIRTEQGYVYTATTGTLTSPVQKLVVRARNRPTTSTASFSVAADVRGTPEMSRSLADTVSSVNVSSPAGSVTVLDASLVSKVGSANTSLAVLFAAPADAYTAGTDRINRGKKRQVDIVSIAIDMRSGTDRSSVLLALVPGNRYSITTLPLAQLGYSSWDGWYIGHAETHTIDSSVFVLSFDPCTPTEAIYDTDRYMDSGELTLSGAITSGATSISAATTGAKFTTAAGDFPFYIQIDSEILQVTNVTAATPQVLTVVRAQLSTTAAAHSSGAVTAMYSPTSIYAY